MRKRAGRILLLGVSTVMGLLGIEVAVRALGLLPDARGALVQDAAATVDGERDRSVAWQVHPYLGWVRQTGGRVAFRGVFPPGVDLPPWTENHRTANTFGFLSPVFDYSGVDEGDFAVGVFGGSVASNLVTIGGRALRDELEARLPEPTSRVVLLNFASGGYKQPQQVMALAQALVLGVPLDLVINLDGYNEVVFGELDASRGHHPVFPSRRHHAAVLEFTSDMPDEEALELAGRVVAMRRRAAELAAAMAESPLARSELLRALVGLKVLAEERRADRIELRLQEVAASSPSVGARLAGLPHSCLGERGACWPLIVDIWERSSRVMDGLLRARDIPYVHFLQPNQYVEASKPLSEEERRVAFREEGRRGRDAARGYRELRARASVLRSFGVRFHDLTGLFEEHVETLYRDACCHLNPRGNELLALAVAERVADLLAEEHERAAAPDQSP